MRILVVNAAGADITAGGTERYVVELARGLAGHEIEFALLAAFPPRADDWSGRSTVLHARDWRDDSARRLRNHLGDLVSQPTRTLRAAVLNASPDVVHTHNLPGITTAIWEVCRRLGLPVVHTIHDYYLHCPRVTLMSRGGERPCRPSPLLCGARTARLTRWTRGVGHVVAVSEHVARSHATWFDSARIHVLRIPVSPLARPLSPPQTPPRKLGYLGALTRVKGVSRLLEAAPQLARLGVRIRIAGDGPMVEQVRQATMAGVVDYVGLVAGEDKLRFMESCDFAVLPSLWDEPGGPPTAGSEWLAGGRPLLVASRGGLREFAERHRCVLTIEPTPSGLVEAVEAVLSPGRFGELRAAVPHPDDGHELRRWLAGHRAIYELALRGPDANC